MKYIVLFSTETYEVCSSLEEVEKIILSQKDGPTVDGVYKASRLSFDKIEKVDFEEAA